MRKWVTFMREKHVDDVSWTNTHEHNYSVFLVLTISVGLAQARPNYCGCLPVPRKMVAWVVRKWWNTVIQRITSLNYVYTSTSKYSVRL